MTTIIDAHTHPYSWSMPERRYQEDPIDKSNEFIIDMNNHGITGAIVLSWFGHVSNKLVSEVVKRNPKRLIGFGKWIYGHHITPEEKAEQVEKAIKDFDFHGIGELCLAEFYPIPPDDIHIHREFTIPMNVIAKLKVPVLIDTGYTRLARVHLKYVNPMLIDDIASVYPDVPIIMGHAGKMESYFHEPALSVAKRHDNVYLECSYQNMKNIEEAVHLIGAEKCLFGTDWNPTPACRDLYKKQLEAVKKADLTDKERELFLGNNLIKLLKIEDKFFLKSV